MSPINRDHMWLENGNARYAELLWEEHANGPAAFEDALHDTYIEALTVDNPPVIQSGRLEDYSPEFWATTAGKGAAILNMLRSVMGNDNFLKAAGHLPRTVRLAIREHRRFSQNGRADLGSKICNIFSCSGWNRAAPRVQAGIHRLPHSKRFPRDG